ncbi:bleomycin resistance protein [Kistimonas asteriae]|uniref:bleomycin resistance protein n=1 Tax=Kistimonas asteriae TaxID=517724 RepID=UPI001FE2A6AA|nr:VOC family protein [Kistimonas asteriae]
MSEYWNVMVPELSVTEFKKSLSFYTDILGFSVRNQRDNPEFAYLEQEKVQLMIEQIHDDSWNTGDLLNPFGRGINLQMEFSNIAPIYQRVKNSKISIYRELTESWYEVSPEVLSGQSEFLVQDPDGYLLRLTQHLGEKPKI